MIRLDSDERRQAIVDTAVPLFARKGFAGTTTRELAEAAGISEALLFRHFPSKHLLYREIRSLMGGKFAEFEWYFQTPDGENYDEFAGRIAGWLDEVGDSPVIAVCHGVVTRVLRGLYAGLPRPDALRLAVPQDRIFRLADGMIAEIIV